MTHLNSQNGALLHVSDRSDHWLITPKYIEPQTDAPQQTQTWVNVSQARAVRWRTIISAPNTSEPFQKSLHNFPRRATTFLRVDDE